VTADRSVDGPRRRGRRQSGTRELALLVIRLRREKGLGYSRLADALNEGQVPTPKGGLCWHRSHVSRLLHTRWVQDIMKELDGE
jgi:hypothetical protein